VESTVANNVTANTSTQSPNLLDSDLSADESTGLTTPETPGTQDATATDTLSADCPLAALRNDLSEPESTEPQTTSKGSTTPDTQTFDSSCPHLISRSDSNIIYDRYLRSACSVDSREGWVYRGSRRMFWLPSDLRPASPIALSAFEDTLVILTRSRSIMCFDLRPMVDLAPIL